MVIIFIYFLLQGNLCLESGVYLANLVACHGCGRKDTIIAKDSSETFSNGDDTQEIVFKREYDHSIEIVFNREYDHSLEIASFQA